MLNRVFDRLDFRIFESPPDIPAVTIPEEFVEDDEGEDELIFVNEGEDPPDTGDNKVEAPPAPVSKFSNMTDEEIQAYVLAQQKAAPPQGIDPNLIANQVAQQLQINQPANRSGESSAEEIARLNKEFLDSENPVGIVQKIISKELQGALNQVSNPIGQTALLALQVNPAYAHYNTYAAEIQAKFNTLSPEQKLHPGAAQWAYNEVINTKIPEITEAAVKKALEEKKAEATKTPDAFSTAPVSPVVSGQGGSVAPKAKKVHKKIVVITARDRRQAAILGQDPKLIAEARLRREGGGY